MTKRPTCHYCGAPATTKDHIIPKSLGGANAEYNLVDSCLRCNQAKANAMPTCGCVKCTTATIMPRRFEGAAVVRQASQMTKPGRRRRRRQRWEVSADGWSAWDDLR